ncbi:MAG: 1-deoxy-D-xylulose-5-phosphate synthase [Candidatus Geothermincolales bacterium]
MSGGRLIDSINGPGDLKGLGYADLCRLAGEIRELILEVTSRVGGHLASSLGAVELAIAVHRVFDSPKDRILWDVGHQAYAHKILTGRRTEFLNLRRRGGISGFPRREESPHDVMNAGHASTAISYALGLAIARDLKGEDYHVVAVIGDGALTGGLAFEALNQLGHLGKRVILVLNDNGMSISRNVGALSTYLSQLRLNPRYRRMKDEIKHVVDSVPVVGPAADRAIHMFKERLKNFLIPEYIFEELGIQYVGAVDGHDIAAMEKDFSLAKEAEGPVLVHVITKKGKGYPPAERNPELYHGVGPFDLETGKVKPSDENPTYTSVFGRTLCRMAEVERRLVAITAAMRLGTGLEEFSRLYPARFYDVGIAEQHAVTLAAGLALGGMRPVVAVYSTFLQRAFDQLIQEICLQRIPVILALDRAGLVGEDGATHHGAFDLSYLRLMPGMTVAAPKDQAELRDLLWAALKRSEPVAIRYPRGGGPLARVEDEPREITWGSWEVVREGKDLVILAVGRMVENALSASDVLARAGLEARVVNARFVKPMDEGMLREASSYPLVVTLEENALAGGFGEGVAAFLRKTGFRGSFVPIGLPDRFVGHGRVEELWMELGLDPSGIAGRIMAAMGEGEGLGSEAGPAMHSKGAG